jgi:hypothetical protein
LRRAAWIYQKKIKWTLDDDNDVNDYDDDDNNNNNNNNNLSI